jgi:hypothetical protein
LQQLSSKKRNSVTGSLILFLGESNYFWIILNIYNYGKIKLDYIGKQYPPTK